MRYANHSDVMTPEAWMQHLFSAQSAIKGGVVRRKVRDVERIMGRAVFEDEIRRRGYRAIENAGHYVIFCNRETLRLVE